MPFWASIAVLSLAQGALVGLPRPLSRAIPRRLRGGWWALLPPASVAIFVLLGSVAANSNAEFLTYLALVTVPPLAALALSSLLRSKTALGAALTAASMFGLAWADRGGPIGEAAALALSGLSCVALGSAIGGLTPNRWLALGILAMALTDTALVVADLLQAPNSTLNAAHPAAGLPRLQTAIFGSAAMGYGDLFIAGLFGGLLANRGARIRQLHGAALTALLALAFDLLFFWVSELPATVPVALALLLLPLVDRRGAVQPASSRRASISAPPGARSTAGSTGSSARS